MFINYEDMNKFLGQKFERNLSFHETAKILGTSNRKLLELLREKDIFFKYDRNLPYDKYIRKGWFVINSVQVNNSGYSGIIPVVKITPIGFNHIEKLIINNYNYINKHNQFTFWKTINFIILKKLLSLDIKIKENNLIYWLRKNTVLFVNNNINIVLLPSENGFIELIKYDIFNKKIFEINNEPKKQVT